MPMNVALPRDCLGVKRFPRLGTGTATCSGNRYGRIDIYGKLCVLISLILIR